MRHQQHIPPVPRHRSRRLASILALAALLAASSGAHAQWAVNDQANLQQQARHILDTIKQWGEQAKRWTDQWNHYQQQLIKLRNLNFRLVKLSQTLSERPEDYNVREACGGGGVLDELKRLLTRPIRLGGNIVDQQVEICQRRILVENLKYNQTVRMFNELSTESQRNLDAIQAQRDTQVGTSQGALAANDNEIQRFIASSGLKMQAWQLQMQAYDAYLEALDRDQSTLAKRALEGDKGGLGQIKAKLVQAAALKAALSVNTID